MSGKAFRLGSDRLTSIQLVDLGRQKNPQLILSPQKKEQIEKDRMEILELLKGEKTVYGVNTGFGLLAHTTIATEDLKTLQENLIRSHACGVGELIPKEVVRSLMVLRLHTFCLGGSGISLPVIDLLKEMLAHDVIPCIPSKGSVGASGDLAPLAHLARALLGEGDVFYEGEKKLAQEVFDQLGLPSLQPGPKEGLSLINGTHVMATMAAHAVEQAKILIRSADIIGAISLNGIRGSLRPFDKRIHKYKPHTGQEIVAENFRKIFSTRDDVLDSHKDCQKVQDSYSFRCIPQVHGASRDVLTFVEGQVETELNSVTDNPLIVSKGELISGGNFHGQVVSMAMDFLAVAMAELGSISERRIATMINPSLSEAPPFLIKNSGVNSGFMIPQVVAAALVSENKVLCHPASVDSIPTSAEKEDHVSMGPIACEKIQTIQKNLEQILAIELLAGCQALDFLRPLRSNDSIEAIHSFVRSQSSFIEKDRSLSHDIISLGEMISQGVLSDHLAHLDLS